MDELNGCDKMYWSNNNKSFHGVNTAKNYELKDFYGQYDIYTFMFGTEKNANLFIQKFKDRVKELKMIV